MPSAEQGLFKAINQDQGRSEVANTIERHYQVRADRETTELTFGDQDLERGWPEGEYRLDIGGMMDETYAYLNSLSLNRFLYLTWSLLT